MKRLASVSVALAWVAAAAAPLAGQSTGPTHEGYDPNAPVGGHYHEGELGEKSLYLEHRLRCNCSCGLDAHSCQFQMQCGVSPVWAARIRRQLAAGDDIETIEAGFVAEFGTQVLMAPPPEGFNLLGYLMPGAAILMSGVLVGLVARGGAKTEAPAPAGPVSPEEEARLREAMRALDEAEGPDW